MSDAAAIPVLEADIREIKAALVRLEPVVARLDERLNHVTAVMATREDLARLEGRLRAEIADVRRALETKPSRGSMWAMAIALVGLVVASIGVGAAYLPLVSRALRQ